MGGRWSLLKLARPTIGHVRILGVAICILSAIVLHGMNKARALRSVHPPDMNTHRGRAHYYMYSAI